MKKNASAAGKTVLLCDDIITSGATMWEAAGVLLAHGAKAVYGVSFCRAMRRERTVEISPPVYYNKFIC